MIGSLDGYAALAGSGAPERNDVGGEGAAPGLRCRSNSFRLLRQAEYGVFTVSRVHDSFAMASLGPPGADLAGQENENFEDVSRQRRSSPNGD